MSSFIAGSRQASTNWKSFGSECADRTCSVRRVLSPQKTKTPYRCNNLVMKLDFNSRSRFSDFRWFVYDVRLGGIVLVKDGSVNQLFTVLKCGYFCV